MTSLLKSSGEKKVAPTPGEQLDENLRPTCLCGEQDAGADEPDRDDPLRLWAHRRLCHWEGVRSSLHVATRVNKNII